MVVSLLQKVILGLACLRDCHGVCVFKVFLTGEVGLLDRYILRIIFTPKLLQFNNLGFLSFSLQVDRQLNYIPGIARVNDVERLCSLGKNNKTIG